MSRWADAAFVERLWAKIDKRGTNECWPWTGATAGKVVHGQISVPHSRSRVYVHRVVYELEIGPIPEGLVVRHSCDNGICCNPAHLLVGTRADNNNDAAERGRMPRGSRHHATKLTLMQVLAIRKDNRTHAQIAQAYGIARQTVGDIKSKRRWSWL